MRVFFASLFIVMVAEAQACEADWCRTMPIHPATVDGWKPATANEKIVTAAGLYASITGDKRRLGRFMRPRFDTWTPADKLIASGLAKCVDRKIASGGQYDHPNFRILYIVNHCADDLGIGVK